MNCYECINCGEIFKAYNFPRFCPACGKSYGFSDMQYFDARGNEITFEEHVEHQLAYFSENIPDGYTKEQILAMTPKELEKLSEEFSEVTETRLY